MDNAIDVVAVLATFVVSGWLGVLGSRRLNLDAIAAQSRVLAVSLRVFVFLVIFLAVSFPLGWLLRLLVD